MMYIGKDDLTMSEFDVENLATQICQAGFPEEFLFQSKANRDAVAKAVRKLGGTVKRGSTGYCVLDIRYTHEGRGEPDLGLGNIHQAFGNLYSLKRTL